MSAYKAEYPHTRKAVIVAVDLVNHDLPVFTPLFDANVAPWRVCSVVAVVVLTLLDKRGETLHIPLNLFLCAYFHHYPMP